MQRCSYNKPIQKLNMKIVPKNLKVILLLQVITQMQIKKKKQKTKQSIKKNTTFRLICQPH